MAKFAFQQTRHYTQDDFSYSDIAETLCSLHVSAVLSYYSALQGAGNWLFRFFFSTEMQKRSLKAALTTIFRRRIEQPCSFSGGHRVWSYKETLGAHHTPIPDAPQLDSSPSASCSTSPPDLALGCPRALAYVGALCWEVAEGYYAASKPCKTFVAGTTA